MLFQKIIDKTNKIINEDWIKSQYNGTGGIGITFEKKLNIETNTFEIPDFENIEIKTKLINSKSYISLFNATPDSYLFEIKRIHQTYGYPDKKEKQYNVFNMSFYTNTKIYIGKNLYGKIKVDRKNHQVILIIIDRYGNLVDSDCRWSFELLPQKLNRKLKYLFLVHGNKKIINNETYYKYLDYDCFILKDFNHFIKCIEEGYIRITFKISLTRTGPKKGQIRDHGTSFDIKETDIEQLYYEIKS